MLYEVSTAKNQSKLAARRRQQGLALQVVLRDDAGELIEPLVREGKITPGAATIMPPLP